MSELLMDEYKSHLIVRKPLKWGLLAGTFLLVVYFLILTVANSFVHSLEQFREMWHWITLLVLGFGTQVALYTYIRAAMKLKKARVAASTVATAGGVSTTAMVACCAHHVTDVLPILGVSAAAVFLNQYQTLFIIVGILSNVIGITLMLRIIQKHNLYETDQRIFAYLMKLNMNKSLYVVSALSAFTFLLTLYRSL